MWGFYVKEGMQDASSVGLEYSIKVCSASQRRHFFLN